MSRTPLLVIGGGAAGPAAARGGIGKARTTQVTEGLLGGDCTWFGCVPSKALLESTRAGLAYPDAVAEVALAMHLDVFAGRLAQAPHAYPTWGSAVQIAAAQLVGEIGGRSARPAVR